MHASQQKLKKSNPGLALRLAGIIVIASLALAACSSSPSGAPSGASATATGSVPQTGATVAATTAPTSAATTAATSMATATGAATSAPAATSAAPSAATSTTSSGYGSTASTPAATAAATTSGAAGAANVPASVTLSIKSGSSVGQYLADEKGMTLYVYKKDTAGASSCTGQCATNWPPLLVAKGGTLTLTGGDSSKLGTITRSDGTTQVTYNSQPLYYFVKDQAPGDTNGQGIGGVWYVAAP